MKKANIECSLMCRLVNDSVDLRQTLNSAVSFDEANHEYEIKKIVVESWEVDEVLRILFNEIQSDYYKLKELIDRDYLKVYVDICIIHYDTYPAIIIEGETMERIRNLKADIAIDMY